MFLLFREANRMFTKGPLMGILITHFTHPKNIKRLDLCFPKAGACLIALLSFMLLAATAFGQGTNATLSGTVYDSSGGAMIGATIMARNVDTGVETRTTTNNAGIYNLSLQPGNYTVYADFTGFQRTVREGVRLTAGSQINLALPMAVAGQVTEIEVTGTVEGMVLEASASTGTLIQEDVIMAIPALNTNVIDATLSVMGGVTQVTTGSRSISLNTQEVAGIPATMINVSRDGITVNELRFEYTGIAAAGNINPEVVGEMRVIQSAVDAEMGRGAGQVQVTTRSGSNAYRGSGVWSIQNTALDATDFSNKSRGLTSNWRNINNYTLSLGGPVIKNKTFFFVSWEQQISRDKVNWIPRVMTSCARRGIYRWLTSPEANGGWLPTVISATDSYAVNTGSMRSVNDDGTPWRGGQVYNSNGGVPVTIGPTTVMFESVFGQLQSDVRRALEDPSNPLGVYGNAELGCTLMDNLGYDPMNSTFLTTTDGQNINGWTNSFTNGGPYRYAYDPTGYADRFALSGANYGSGKTAIMPPANYFRGQGDGLNTAGHRWTTAVVGQGASAFGTGGDPDRKAITARIDHNISNDHRLSGTFSYETFTASDNYRTWPEEYGGSGGNVSRKPLGFTINLNSTLAPTLMNEFRIGLSRSNTWSYTPLTSPANKDTTEAVLRAMASNDANNPYYAGSWAQDQLLLIGLGDGEGGAPGTTAAGNGMAYRVDVNPVMNTTENIDRSHHYGSRGAVNSTWGGEEPRWSIAENLTWIKGSHQFKGGIEYRRQSTYQYSTGTSLYTRGGGNTDLTTIRGGILAAADLRRRGSLSSRGFGTFDGVNYLYGNSQDIATNAASGSYVLPYNMMSYFSGSLSDIGMFHYAVPDPTAPTGARWNDLEAGEKDYAYTIRNQEFSWFFKDDWKVTNNLTLNLGVRWEYYGVPNASEGRTIAVKGGSQKAWGLTEGGDFYNNGKGWVVDRNYLSGFQRDAAGNPVLPDPVIEYQYVGPGSVNSNLMPWNRDLNNFAPHVGFAWQLPWFGRGLTTLRGGYSVSYSSVGSFNEFNTWLISVDAAGTTYTNTYTGTGATTDPTSSLYYMDLTDLRNLLPMRAPSSVEPLGVKQNDAIFAYASAVNDENLRSPYVHSLNMSLTRSIGNMFTVDLRYIGTFRRSSVGTLNVNQNTFLDTTLLNWISELDTVRAGGESMYINSLITQNRSTTPGDLYYSTVVGETGSDQIRRQAGANLSRGVYNTIVSSLFSTNGQLPQETGAEVGLLMRSGCLPGDRPGYAAAFAADDRVDVNNFPCTVGTPLNMYYAAPQYGTSNIRHNTDAVNNYNSMQAQVTMRPAYGLNFQATYTWSRNLSSNTWSNYLDERDYLLNTQHRSHTLRFFGSYELPFGQSGLLLREASNPVRKAVEGWQISWVMGMESGPPVSVTGASVLWGRGWPILVRSDLWDDKQGKARMEWGPNGEFLPGTYLGRDYVKVLDRNICNPDRMTSDLYEANCERAGIANTAAPHAVALGARQPDGSLVAARYERDTMGDDGILYSKGDEIIVFRNADQSDGRNATGTYKPYRMTALGRFSFDMSMTKKIEFMEGKSFEIRVDAQNILNHATPIGTQSPSVVESGGRWISIDNPSFNASNVGVMGELLNKVGHRSFQARLAVRF